MNELTKIEPNAIEITDNETRVKAQNFLKLLHKQPDKSELKTNTQAGNSKYLPISFLEMKLDEMFFGVWSTVNFTYLVIANEVVGSLEVRYFHPTLGVWLSRIGAGAAMIQQEKGAEITDISKKYKNTLTKDFPHMKAECFRNACLSIGKAFGRDLNREFEDQYNPIIKAEPDDVAAIKKKLIDALDTYQDEDKKEIEQLCMDKVAAGEFTVEFAHNVAKQMGLEL